MMVGKRSSPLLCHALASLLLWACEGSTAPDTTLDAGDAPPGSHDGSTGVEEGHDASVSLPEPGGKDAGPDEPDDPLEGYTLTWSDEFEVPGAPDAAHWNFEVQGPGWVNEELQNYTDRRSENARVEAGVLVIEARRDFFDGDEYSSARLHSAGKGELTYGRVEVRARVPEGLGTWPAIWMMPSDVFRHASTCTAETGWDEDCDAWPGSGEIDIMEHVGYDPGVVHATIHCRAYNWMQPAQRTATVSVPDATDTFHVYAVERTAERIEVSIDGKVYFGYDNDGQGSDTWPFDAPFYVILNVAVGGIWGGMQGVDANAFPARLEVDYVRIYERR